MKKFKTSEKGFLDSSYNFEEVKKQFQDRIDKAKSKLNNFKEGEDYTLSYEDNGQKKVYTVHSLNMKRCYWGDNIIEGFEYLLEESEEGVSAKMKMTNLLGTQSQKVIEMSSDGQQNGNGDKVSILRKELQEKERDISLLANHPEKQSRLRVEVENIKASIEEIIKQSDLKQGDNQKSNQFSDSNGNGWQKYGGSGFFGSLSLLSLLFFLV